MEKINIGTNTFVYPNPVTLLGAPHTGQIQSSGRSSKAVPRLTLGRSPISGSYMYPHTVHRYFVISSPHDRL